MEMHSDAFLTSPR